jgi:hypothetical protein
MTIDGNKAPRPRHPDADGLSPAPFLVEISMKKLVLAVLCISLLSACPMPGGPSPANPSPITSNETKCSLLVELAAPAPEPQQWTGELPQGSATSAWVLIGVGDPATSWVLVLVEPDKLAAVASFSLTKEEERREAITKVAAQQFNFPQILLAILGSVRPFPQPGPPGDPGRWIYRRAVSTAVSERRIQNELRELGALQSKPQSHVQQ